MREAIEQLGQEVARQAQVELAGRSFGAVAAVDYLGADSAAADDTPHWQLKWRADLTGEQREVQLVILPEFLEMDSELLVSQLVIMLTQLVLEGLAA